MQQTTPRNYFLTLLTNIEEIKLFYSLKMSYYLTFTKNHGPQRD